MSKEMKALLGIMIKYDITLGIILAIILSFIDIKFACVFLLGLFIAVTNFIVSGIILEKSLNSTGWIKGMLFPFTYLIRIIIIIIIALPFMYDLKEVIAYLLGFITHFPILMFSWFKRQKGSE